MNVKTQETTWEYPSEDWVFDPDTQQLFTNPLLRSKTGHENEGITVPKKIGEETQQQENPQNETPQENQEKPQETVKVEESRISKSQQPSASVIPITVNESKQNSDPNLLGLKTNKFNGARTYTYNVSEEGQSPIILEIDQSIMNFDLTSLRSANNFKLENQQTTHIPSSFLCDNLPPENKTQSQNVEQPDTTAESQAQEAQQAESEAPKPEDSKIVFQPKVNQGTNYLPADAEKSSREYSLTKYAESHFNVHPKKGRLSRKNISMESLTSFDTQPIATPLLKNLPDDCQKLALKMFNFILVYTKVQKNKAKVPPSLMKFVGMLKDEPRLIDEAYFQVMKQTNGNPPVDNLVHAWELLLTLATIFPSSKGVEMWVKSHIAKNLKNANRGLRLISAFTYIRYCTRMAIGEPMENLTEDYVSNIPTHPLTFNTTFGASIYAIMWCQRRQHPTYPIPYFLVQMCAKLIQMKCYEVEGIFRMPGSMSKVEEFVVKANQGVDVIPLITNPHDGASLIKRWFRDITDLVVPSSMAGYLTEAGKNDQFIEFAAALPPVNSMTLGYLIGFLQEVAKYQNITKMGPKNLAMVFAPNIVQFDVAAAAGSTKLDAGIGQFFLEQLIEKWDVSLIYPMELEKDNKYKLNEVL
ncbi:RhoGAP domain containing protein [Trichomonas vaginalis G3]|uniref:RhoGAP domain containing protein n=2 Tax=Trichomonas vaginalis (strain ATCC PRA-98 / G3) TaxID=412133 RepID=A2E606_TRIV3|nr:RhoGAP domain containing protein [Trichomonas vaginalis G3]|eukprot:XP_001324186.1 RhoGAP domain containing protein [Trichomonas vaginalis G3]